MFIYSGVNELEEGKSMQNEGQESLTTWKTNVYPQIVN